MTLGNQGLVFITGGARSGKSTFAEEYGHLLADKSNKDLHYIATGKPTDNEMKKRIERHKLQRFNSDMDWKTWECPLDIGKLANSFTLNDIVLIDCLTLLITNELFRDSDSWRNRAYQTKVYETILKDVQAIQSNAKRVIIVSNEVLNDSTVDSPLVQTYKGLIGSLHQEIVRIASKAFMVEAGIPILMKGKLESGEELYKEKVMSWCDEK